jgi:hypothetical protein
LVSASTEVAATQTTGSSSAGEAGDAIPTPADGWQAFGGGWPNTGLAPLFSKLVEPTWRSLLEAEMKKDYVKEIAHFLELRRAKVRRPINLPDQISYSLFRMPQSFLQAMSKLYFVNKNLHTFQNLQRLQFDSFQQNPSCPSRPRPIP